MKAAASTPDGDLAAREARCSAASYIPDRDAGSSAHRDIQGFEGRSSTPRANAYCRLGEDRHVAAAVNDRGQLQNAVIGNRRWWYFELAVQGLRNHGTSTPSSATRFNTPFAPMMEVFTAPARIRPPTKTTNMWKIKRTMYGPLKFIASPPIRLATYFGRSASGMIMLAKSVTNPVQNTAYQQTMLAVMRRFLSLG